MNGHIGEYDRADGSIPKAERKTSAKGGFVGEYNYSMADGFIGEYHNDNGSWAEDEYKDYDDYADHDFGTIAPDVSVDSSDDDDENKKGANFKSWFDWSIGSANSILDIKDRLQQDGTTVDEDNYSTQITPGTQPKKDMTLWYVGGGALVLLVVVGFVMKKNS